MGGGSSKELAAAEVWPPGWLEIPEGPRLIARTAILTISSMTPDEFCAMSGAPYCIPADQWDFAEFHAAAAAAVQEDAKINKLTYACVPRRMDESDFWRLYFSKVLYILDSVKQHGTYPPPVAEPSAAPPPQQPSEEDRGCLVQ